MHIGLIGGIGPAATDFYYRRLIDTAAQLERPLDLTMVHADTLTLLGNLLADDKQAQCDIYLALTKRLAAAGADNVVVTSIAGHFCIDRFAEVSPLPVIDLTKAVSEWLREKRMSRVGILGTETVMSSGMYGKLAPVDVIAPGSGDLQRVHDAYVTLAKSGRGTPELEKIFVESAEAMIRQGAEAVMLGGTDLNAIFDEAGSPFPVVDCAGIHVAAISQFI